MTELLGSPSRLRGEGRRTRLRSKAVPCRAVCKTTPSPLSPPPTGWRGQGWSRRNSACCPWGVSGPTRLLSDGLYALHKDVVLALANQRRTKHLLRRVQAPQADLLPHVALIGEHHVFIAFTNTQQQHRGLTDQERTLLGNQVKACGAVLFDLAKLRARQDRSREGLSACAEGDARRSLGDGRRRTCYQERDHDHRAADPDPVFLSMLHCSTSHLILYGSRTLREATTGLRSASSWLGSGDGS